MGKKETFLQIFLVVTAVVLLLVAGAGLFWFYQTKIAVPAEQATPTATPTVEEALSSPTPISPTPTETEEVSDLEQIRQALANKHSKPVEDANVTIQNNTGEYAKGGIVFEGEIAGGWWLAANIDGEWIIVADGNGSVLCADIEGYDFPTSMVPECWDEATSQIVYR